MSADLQIGLVGFGRIATHHADALSRLGTRLVVASRSSENRRRARDAGAVETYANHLAMFEQEKLDGCVICVPVLPTPTVLEECLSHGIPLLVEKPVGLHPEETLRLAERAEELGCPVMVAMNRRFYSNVRAVLRFIEEEGPLLGITVNAPDPLARIAAQGLHPNEVLESWLYANICHCLDLVRFWGGEVSEVRAWRRDSGRELAPSYAATMVMQNGALAQYVGHFASPGRWRLEVYLPDLRIEFQGLEDAVALRSDGSREPVPLAEDDRVMKPGFIAQARYFISSVGAGEPARSFQRYGLRDATATMELIRSIHEGRVVPKAERRVP